jgi:hypothetical protein
VTDVLATAADESYGYHALNLVGSVKRNSNIFDRIEVFDLGLLPRQHELLSAVPGVIVRDVPPFVPHWAQCFTWKPWAWMQVTADRVFWLDAGASVLRSLGRALDQIEALGYFVVSQGNELGDIVPPDYFESYGLSTREAGRPYVAAGIVGFRPDAEFFRRILEPTYADCVAGRNLGYSAHELHSKNRGLSHMESPPIRDCVHFRWDQTLLNIHLTLEMPDATVADLDEYAGWRSARDHPGQVIWSHRRPASLRYLGSVPQTGPGAWRRRAFSRWWQIRWWLALHRHLLQPRIYGLKARSMIARRRPS